MGRPQLGFPRLRIVAGRAGGIAIGPDHTPPWVTRAAESTHGRLMVRGSGRRGDIFGRMAVSVEMHTGCVPALRSPSRKLAVEASPATNQRQ
jgi:hypothetical protein